MTIPIRNPQTGEMLEVSEEMFDQVYSAQGYEKVDPDKSLSEMTRDELNTHAASVGVENPESLPNKDAVIEAIESAQK